MPKVLRLLTAIAAALTVLCSQAQTLDSHHLMLNADVEEGAQPFTYSSLQSLLPHIKDTTTIYVAPGVYWADDPDDPTIAGSEQRKSLIGMEIEGKRLHFIGLTADPRNQVFASQRGQTQGAIGNFTMFLFRGGTFIFDNLTLGNYCNVDLEYPLNPKLNRKKRSSAITQAHVGYIRGDSVIANNVRFISRLNLNPLSGARYSLYTNCHFECTDDALTSNGIYRHCDFDLYGQKPFYTTAATGALLWDCDLNIRSNNSEVFLCKSGGTVTMSQCRWHAPNDSLYIGWTAYPQKYLRCYQHDVTLNGRPITIGAKQPENTIVLQQQPDSTKALHLMLDKKVVMAITPDTFSITADEPVEWLLPKKADGVATVLSKDSKRLTLCAHNDTNDDINFRITAIGSGHRQAATDVTLIPSELPAPKFKKKPKISLYDGLLSLNYKLNNGELRDESRITWRRNGYAIAVSHDRPQATYRLTPFDLGQSITAEIEPKHNRSRHGLPKTAITFITPYNKHARALALYALHHSDYPIAIETDFSNFPCEWQTETTEGHFTIDGYKPADTNEYSWDVDPKKDMWTYGEGFNGAVGKGLLQAQRGARIMFTPAGRDDVAYLLGATDAPDSYRNQHVTLLVDPTKTAGQGFGSATGQYMDVCLKFNTTTLTGYGLRIIRTTKHAKAVDFMLVEYADGQTKPLTEPVSATCYRTGCTIRLEYRDGLLTADVTTTTPKPADSSLPHEVHLKANMPDNGEGGFHLQHTGTCGESTTMLHNLKLEWQ